MNDWTSTEQDTQLLISKPYWDAANQFRFMFGDEYPESLKLSCGAVPISRAAQKGLFL